MGITVNSGCLNPELLKGRKGARVFSGATLRERIDAIIAHEYEEDRLGSHEAALTHAMKTKIADQRWGEADTEGDGASGVSSLTQARTSTFRSNPSLVST